MERAVAWTILLSLPALASAGCGGGGDTSTTPAAPVTSQAPSTTSTASSGSAAPPTTSTSTASTTSTSVAPGASVEFVSPRDGTTTGPTIHANVAVGDFQGGLRFTMQGEPTRFTASSVPGVTYSNLPSGQHTLHVELVGNDNAPTGVGASTTFIVKIVP